ncbi:MAG: hypothetical protein KGJ34_00860 [Patescibacteria group bacterium]|nr:hypothetical protein [Patescibacteria group bacterium]
MIVCFRRKNKGRHAFQKPHLAEIRLNSQKAEPRLNAAAEIYLQRAWNQTTADPDEIARKLGITEANVLAIAERRGWVPRPSFNEREFAEEDFAQILQKRQPMLPANLSREVVVVRWEVRSGRYVLEGATPERFEELLREGLLKFQHEQKEQARPERVAQ